MTPCVLLCRALDPCPISTAGPVEVFQRAQRFQNTTHAAKSWHAKLQELVETPAVTFGTPEELAAYRTYVQSCIEQAACLARLDSAWSDCVSLLVPLARALELVKAGKTSCGRAVAVELIGYAQLAQLAEQLKFGGGNALSSGGKLSADGDQQPISSRSSSRSSSMASVPAVEFKVPAAPSKRHGSPGADEQQKQPAQLQDATSDAQQVAGEQQPQQKRHSAPKRRATPQVWAGGPICITPAAPPNSSMHGEACCDETLLPYWCPMSGKRLKLDTQQLDGPDTVPEDAEQESSTGATQELQQQPQLAQVQQQAVAMVPAQASTEQPAAQHRPCQGSVSPSSSASTGTCVRAPSQNASGRPPIPPSRTLSRSRSAVSSARSDAIEALKCRMHEDAASKPAADTLLFNKAVQLPITNWTGPIKHKASGRVVEVCSLTLQVPEIFLEEFPKALYAAEIRHRKSVSLGRHVVCRATLQPLSEHQLAGLSAMASAQLVAVCLLQTAELHVVPYFDNRNHVRCVGFLKIKAV